MLWFANLKNRSGRDIVTPFLKFRTPLFLFFCVSHYTMFSSMQKIRHLVQTEIHLFSFSVSARNTFIIYSTRSYSLFPTEEQLRDFIIFGKIFINQRFSSHQKRPPQLIFYNMSVTCNLYTKKKMTKYKEKLFRNCNISWQRKTAL